MFTFPSTGPRDAHLVPTTLHCRAASPVWECCECSHSASRCVPPCVGFRQRHPTDASRSRDLISSYESAWQRADVSPACDLGRAPCCVLHSPEAAAERTPTLRGSDGVLPESWFGSLCWNQGGGWAKKRGCPALDAAMLDRRAENVALEVCAWRHSPIGPILRDVTTYIYIYICIGVARAPVLLRTAGERTHLCGYAFYSVASWAPLGWGDPFVMGCSGRGRACMSYASLTPRVLRQLPVWRRPPAWLRVWRAPAPFGGHPGSRRPG